MMAWKEYEYFLAIAEEQNITKAAQKLYISQPSLTQYLQRIEKELGCALLIRTNCGVRLTQEGEAYLRVCRQMQQLFKNFQSEIGQLRQMQCGKLRIGASWYITTTFLSPFITKFAKQYPGIEIDCLESRSSILMEKLTAGQIDAAFVSRCPYEVDCFHKGLAYIPLYRDPFCVIAPPNFPLEKDANCAWLNVGALEGQPLIAFRPNQRIRQITDRILSQANVTPQIRLCTYGFPIALDQVAGGLGLAIVPRGYVERIESHQNVQVFDMNPSISAYWEIGLYVPRCQVKPFALKAFTEQVVRCGKCRC